MPEWKKEDNVVSPSRSGEPGEAVSRREKTDKEGPWEAGI